MITGTPWLDGNLEICWNPMKRLWFWGDNGRGCRSSDLVPTCEFVTVTSRDGDIWLDFIWFHNKQTSLSGPPLVAFLAYSVLRLIISKHFKTLSSSCTKSLHTFLVAFRCSCSPQLRSWIYRRSGFPSAWRFARHAWSSLQSWIPMLWCLSLETCRICSFFFIYVDCMSSRFFWSRIGSIGFQ